MFIVQSFRIFKVFLLPLPVGEVRGVGLQRRNLRPSPKGRGNKLITK
jgi:hypothetical protein